MEKWPLGVFTSIDAGLGVSLEFARELGVPTIHLHAPHGESRSPEKADAFKQQLAAFGLKLTCVFGGFEGESYADIPTTQRTIGFVPAETRATRLAEMKEIADFAKRLDVQTVGLHIGFIPHDTSEPTYQELLLATRELLDYLASQDQQLNLETGQETADELLEFIRNVGRENLFINFDPANMILYGTGEPIEALAKVGHLVRSVHVKDATWSDEPGKTWGTEEQSGHGQVNMEKFLQTLDAAGYRGPLTIEREIPQEPERQQREIRETVELLNTLRAKIG